LCAFPKLGPAFSTSYALVLFCVQLRWELAGRFVDIGGIVKHHCLNEDLDILVILFSCTAYLFRDSVVIHDIYWPNSIVLYDMHWPDYVVLYDALMRSSYTTYIYIILSSYTTYIEEGYSRNASCALILISSIYTFGIFTLFDFSCFVKMMSFEDCNVNFGILLSFHVFVQHMYFVFLSSGTTYFDLILSAYMTYIDLIMSSYMTYIDLILSAYEIFIDLILLSDTTYIAMIMSSYATFIDLILLSDTTYIAMIMSSYATIIDLIMSSYMRYILTYYILFIPQLLTWFYRLIWHMLTRFCLLVRHLLTKTSKTRDKY
jgi:hypothetical protein